VSVPSNLDCTALRLYKILEMKLKDILSLEKETYDSLGKKWTEVRLRVRCTPEQLLQFLAFKGQAHIDGLLKTIEDWRIVDPAIIQEIRMTTLISYPTGSTQREPDGTYLFISAASTATVEPDGIHMPSPADVLKHARNRKTQKLL